MFKKSMLKISISTVISICIIFTFSLLTACGEETPIEEVPQVEEATDMDTKAEEPEVLEEEIQEESTEEEFIEEPDEDVVEEEVEAETLLKEGEVTFMTEDNIELNGNIFGSGSKWVILSHMYPTDQTSWFEFAEMLIIEKEGYSVLTYDFRGYGKSGGSKDVSKVDIDLAAALEYIKQYDPELIYLMGASMGGTASLVVASKTTETLDGIISFSSPDEFEGISAINVVGDIVPAKLFIASQGDEDATRSATEMYDQSMEPKQLEILDGDSHGTFIFEEEPENAEKFEEIVLFFLY
jgi:alpha/beta superfamily hydrolase